MGDLSALLFPLPGNPYHTQREETFSHSRKQKQKQKQKQKTGSSHPTLAGHHPFTRDPGNPQSIAEGALVLVHGEVVKQVGLQEA